MPLNQKPPRATPVPKPGLSSPVQQPLRGPVTVEPQQAPPPRMASPIQGEAVLVEKLPATPLDQGTARQGLHAAFPPKPPQRRMGTAAVRAATPVFTPPPKVEPPPEPVPYYTVVPIRPFSAAGVLFLVGREYQVKEAIYNSVLADNGGDFKDAVRLIASP